MNEKVKREMAKVILEGILGKPVSLKSLKLLVVRTKKEIDLDRSLITWHKNAPKRKFFIGDKRVPRGV
mgnify:CR=1 FL=1